MSIKKNLLEIESSRLELIEKSINSSSNFLRLSLYHNYFEKVLSLNDTNIQEAFLAEFIEDYINCICKFEVWGVEPDSTKIIIEVLKRISQLKIVNNYSDEIKYEITRIEEQKEKLKLILDGNEFQSEKSAKAFFPLIDNEAPYEFYGIVDSITVKISKASDGDKFIIVPSETEIEKRIAEQCTQSWLLALTLLKRYVKAPYKFHEVIISFDRKMGFYEGNSLGIALTLSFLQSLLNFYNPSYLINIKSQSAFTGGVLYVKNKNGKVLWAKLVNVSKAEIQSNRFKNAKIVDIENDGKNEVLICGERDANNNFLINSAAVTCYNSEGIEIWQRVFRDKVISEREILDTNYTVHILDTLTYNGQKSVLLFASNNNSFSSAIYRLDLKTGNRLPGTFWASGHIMDGIIKDVDNDSKQEVVGVGYDNGYEDLVFFIIENDTLTTMRPTTNDYLLRGIPFANMKQFIRIPKTDYDNYYKSRTPEYFFGSYNFDNENKKFSWATKLRNDRDDVQVGYVYSIIDSSIEIVIDSDFRVIRDSLVASGKLKPPYTDTKEYKEILKNNILYWKDGKWVKASDI